MIKATLNCMAWAHHSESNIQYIYKCIEIGFFFNHQPLKIETNLDLRTEAHVHTHTHAHIYMQCTNQT